MTDMPKQHLSALMDDHVDDSSAALDNLTEQDHAFWERMHLTRDVLRGEYAPLLDDGFAARVSAALDDAPRPERDDNVVPLVAKAAPEPRRNWRQIGSGLAVAATVAAVSVLGWRSLSPVSPEGAAPALVQNAPSVQPAGTSLGVSPRPQVQLVNNSGTYWVVGNQRIEDTDTEERLNSLLSDHLETSTARSVSGALPYGRLVGYDEADR